MQEITSKILSRRAMLSGAAVLGAGLALAGCSTAQIATFEQQWATVAGTIQQAVAKASAYIPTIESIAATAASLFGPQYAAIVQIGTAAFNQIVATLTNIVNNLSPPAQAKLTMRLSVSSPRAPIAIGVTPSGVRVTGYQV
jgi:hypothetical protein